MCNSTGELGHSSAALTAVQQALLLDPMNADLIAQAKELHIIEKEKLEEKKMMMMMMKNSKKIVNDAKDDDDKDDHAKGVIGVKVGSDDNEDQLIIKDRRRRSSDKHCIIGSGDDNSNLADELNKYLISLDNYNNTATANNSNNNDDDVKGDDHSNNNAQLVKIKINIITGIEKDNALKMTFRLSGCIQQLIKTIHRYTEIYKQIVDDVDDDDNSNNSNNSSSKSSDDGNSKRSNVKMILSNCYDILAIIIDQQRASKLLIIELKLITSIKSLIKFIHINTDISLLKSLIHLCYVLCYDDICMKSMNIIIGDKIILCYLSTCIGNISYNLNTLLSNISTTTTTTTTPSTTTTSSTTTIKSDDHNNNNSNDINNNFKDKIECLEISIKIFKIALFSTISQNIFNTLESSVSCTIAYSITTMFQCALSYYNKITKDDYLVIYESVSR